MGNIDQTVEDMIQNKILVAVEIIGAPRIELAVKSFGQEATSVTAKTEREGDSGITASFGNLTGRNNTLRDLNANDETRGKVQSQVSKLSVQRLSSKTT